MFLKYDSFFLIKTTIFRIVDLRFSRSFHFILVLFYKLQFLTNYVTSPKLTNYFCRPFL
jgi:hypothetical protein